MRTEHLRALSHHYLLTRLAKLPEDHLQSLYARYASLMANLHEAVEVDQKAAALLVQHQQYLDQGCSPEAATNKSLDDFIHLHANFNWRHHTGSKIPVNIHGFVRQTHLDYIYRKAADALVEGITACLLWSHSDD